MLIYVNDTFEVLMKFNSKLRNLFIGVCALTTSLTASADPFGGSFRGKSFDGAVYAMSNKIEGNSVVAYGRKSDGTLDFIGEFNTGGFGSTDFDGGEGLDPLISQYSVLLTDDRRFLFAVNVGSSSVSLFQVRDNLSLRLVDVAKVRGVGPNSLAFRDGVLYVSTIDADGVFTAEPDQEGALQAFRLLDVGATAKLLPVKKSRRLLNNRPSSIQFSPDGRFLVVSSINAGSSGLASGSTDEIVVYSVSRSGLLSKAPVDAATSTLPNNAEGRNLPSAIGFDIVEDDGRQFVVVTEAREFQPNGLPPAFPALQAGSVSTWELGEHGELSPIVLDAVASATGDVTDGERTVCWIEFSDDKEEFWVSNALDSSISTYSFNEGVIELVDVVAAQVNDVTSPDPSVAFGIESDGFIDLSLSDNGKYLYQLAGLRGSILVFKTEDNGELTLIQTVTGDLPVVDSQGIAAF